MEVHHHSHTSRKKWTHYFWEFLMLFLAVFCGFLAEYQLEHKIEKERAKEYARALYDDVVSDTAYLKNIIEETKKDLSYQDTLADLLHQMSVEEKKVPGAALYYYAARSRTGTLFSVKTSTINQLKNSGSLRLLRKPELIKLFTNYDQAISIQHSRLESDLGIRDALVESMRQIFSFSEYEKLEKLFHQFPHSGDSLLQLDLPLLSREAKLISDLSYALHSRMRNYRSRIIKYYAEPLDAGVKLIEALKKEYHFE